MKIEPFYVLPCMRPCFTPKWMEFLWHGEKAWEAMIWRWLSHLQAWEHHGSMHGTIICPKTSTMRLGDLKVEAMQCSIAKSLVWEGLLLAIRYVGVLWFLFHVLQLLPPINQYLCCISEYTIKCSQRLDLRSEFPWFSYDYWKCNIVDLLIRYMGPPNCVHY